MQKFDTKKLIERIRNMDYFTVSLQLDEKPDFPIGKVPFDLKISKDDVITATILAESEEDAKNKLWEYLNK